MSKLLRGVERARLAFRDEMGHDEDGVVHAGLRRSFFLHPRGCMSDHPPAMLWLALYAGEIIYRVSDPLFKHVTSLGSFQYFIGRRLRFTADALRCQFPVCSYAAAGANAVSRSFQTPAALLPPRAGTCKSAAYNDGRQLLIGELFAVVRVAFALQASPRRCIRSVSCNNTPATSAIALTAKPPNGADG